MLKNYLKNKLTYKPSGRYDILSWLEHCSYFVTNLLITPPKLAVPWRRQNTHENTCCTYQNQIPVTKNYKEFFFIAMALLLIVTNVQSAPYVQANATGKLDIKYSQFYFNPTVNPPTRMKLRSVWSSGMFRWYRVHEPVGYNPSKPTPVVLAFHGGGGNARRFAKITDMHVTADQGNFLLVYPEGTGNQGGPPNFSFETWNAGNCCGYAQTHNIDDVQFVRRLVTKLATEWNVDLDRVFATGHSNGAMMSYRLGMEAPDLIRAIAPNAGALGISGLPAAPISIMAIHGKLDTNVPWQGGIGTGPSGTDYASQSESLHPFAIVNGVSSLQFVEMRGQAKRFEAIATSSGETIEYWWLKNGGHSWPSTDVSGNSGQPTNNDINANDEIWKFFSQF